jgi:hypothetical protein
MIVSGETGRRASREPVILTLQDGSKQEIEVAYPRDDVPVEYTVKGLKVLAVNNLTAALTWLLEKDIAVFGPDFVRDFSLNSSGYTIDDEYHGVDGFPAEPRFLTIYSGADKIESKIIRPDRPRFPTVLWDWEVRVGSPEIKPEFDDSDWSKSNTPRDMLLELDNYWHEYGWYRANMNSPRDGKAVIRFSKIGDRVVLFVNGERVGETDYHAETAEFEVDLKKGDNVLAILANSLGVTNHPAHWGPMLGFLVMPKGIAGPVTVKLPGKDEFREVKSWRFRSGLFGEVKKWFDPENRGEPVWKSEVSEKSGRVVWYRTKFDLDDHFLEPANPIMVRMDGMIKGDIWLNGHHIGRYWQIGPQRDYYLPCSWLKEKDNLLVLAEEYGGWPDPAHVRLINAWDREMNGELHWRVGVEHERGYFYSAPR